MLLKAGGLTVYFGPIDGVTDYFVQKGADKPDGVNPAEYMIDQVSGKASSEDWSKVWLESDECKKLGEEIDKIKNEKHEDVTQRVDDHKYAASQVDQCRIVLRRASTQLFRQTDYIKGKVFLHIGSALFNSFT